MFLARLIIDAAVVVGKLHGGIRKLVKTAVSVFLEYAVLFAANKSHANSSSLLFLLI